MKKLIFTLTIFIWAGILVLLSFSRDTPDQKDGTVSIDFSEWEKLYAWSANKKSFAETSLTGANTWADSVYLHRFSPIDSIYYRSIDRKPLSLAQKGGTNIVTLGTGVFVCNIQTGLEKYEFHLNDITLKPKGRGVFLVRNTGDQMGIFSFDAFMDIELTDNTSRTPITSFTLFPSLLFQHNPKNTPGLRKADILRISIVDSIRYIDMKTMEDGKVLFSWNNQEKDRIFLSLVQTDITEKINAFVALYSSLAKHDSKKLPSASFFDASTPLLVNGSKREILLKNTLVQNIRQTLNTSQKTPVWTSVYETVSEMQSLSPKVYNDGISLLKQYYYIATFARFVNRNDSPNLSEQPTPLISITEKIITNGTGTKQGEYYTQLSNLFSTYYFLVLKPQELNNSFEQILQRILDNKVLSKDEFLPFVFFVTQYLSTGPTIVPNEDSMLIISHLFQITNDYYTNNKSDPTKLTTITSTIFYNYTQIFTKMYSMFVSTFIDTTPEGMLLKKVYTENGESNLEPNFTDAFAKVIKTAKEDTKSKKAVFYFKNSLQSDSGITDSYTLLQNTLDSFDKLVSMFTNYPKYLNDSHLDESSKSARGILVEKWAVMSREILGAYLKNFNSLDISSLQVTNNFQKDGFYEVQVNIMGSTFHFKLWEQNHILADIAYTDSSGTKHTFPNITIPLDEKEEQFKELGSSGDDPALRYKYDFKNFFETTFLKGDSSISTQPDMTSVTQNTPSASPEILLFIQKELLDKDFKNIRDFLPIEFKNITASINEGNYLIELNNMNKVFVGDSSSYPVEFSSKYLFNRHSFSRITFKVKTEAGDGYEFRETPVEILPARISVLSLPDTLKDLGSYIDTIKASYTSQQSIVIDFVGKKVLLDKVPFVVKFKTE